MDTQIAIDIKNRSRLSKKLENDIFWITNGAGLLTCKNGVVCVFLKLCDVDLDKVLQRLKEKRYKYEVWNIVQYCED